MAVSLRLFDQLHQERLGRRRLAFLVAAGGVNCAQSGGTGELERQHAPRMAQRTGLAVGRSYAVKTPLNVDLVETERHRQPLAAFRRPRAPGNPAPLAGRAGPPDRETGDRA